jgi:hypothetical protein
MRQILLAILGFLYLTSTVGATVHFHYCMDKLVDSGLWRNEDKKCGKCGMDKSQEKENGCCKDEQKQVKVETEHKGVSHYQLNDAGIAILPALLFETPDTKISTVTEHNPLSHAPPRCGDIAVYIQNCVFRI